MKNREKLYRRNFITLNKEGSNAHPINSKQGLSTSENGKEASGTATVSNSGLMGLNMLASGGRIEHMGRVASCMSMGTCTMDSGQTTRLMELEFTNM